MDWLGWQKRGNRETRKCQSEVGCVVITVFDVADAGGAGGRY